MPCMSVTADMTQLIDELPDWLDREAWTAFKDMRKAKGKLTPGIARSLLSYEPETGVLRWRQSIGARSCIGGEAGSMNSKGYVHVQIDGKKYKAHRLAFAIHTGAWPEKLVDHENGIKSDNRWDNIRPANNAFNCQNSRVARKNNKTGYLGVHFERGRYVAEIWVDGRAVRLGDFDEPQPAHEAYITAKRIHHPGCTL